MKELSESDFESVIGDGVVLIDFSAEWCGPCKVIHPILERLSGEYNGSVSFYSVDIDEFPSLAARNGVMSVPTLLIFSGGAPVDRIVGAVSERELKERIGTHIEN